MPDRPLKKPGQFLKVLETLNTPGAKNTIDPQSYVNLVGEYAKKAHDSGELSFREYMGIVKPLFGRAGEMVSQKIAERDRELNKYSVGGRAKLQDGKLAQLGNIVDVRNIPYYASKTTEGVVNAGEILSKLPFAVGDLASKLLREKPSKEMFLSALNNIQPGSFSEAIGLSDLIARQEENLSPETKTAGSQLSLTSETFVPLTAAIKLGDKIIKTASKKLGKVDNKKHWNKVLMKNYQTINKREETLMQWLQQQDYSLH